MSTNKDGFEYLICEKKIVYILLMCSAGMMGAYTFNMRGGVFCNAQTANIVMMSIAFGKGNIRHGFYFLIPVFAYFFGAVLSEALPNPVKKLGFLRWDTYLIAFETLTLFLIGLIPLRMPDQIVQVIINFIASMQYNTFRQAEGIPMATTFCTNHIRQLGIAFVRVVKKHDRAALKRGSMHFFMVFSFFMGGMVLTFLCKPLQEKAIWLALIPMGILLCSLVYADLTVEHDLLDRKPSGH